MSIAVGSFHFSGQQELADITEANKVAYCVRHGYANYVMGSRDDWSALDKLALARKALRENAAFLWIDCDAMFMNPEIRVESLMTGAPLTITRDGENINSGVFIMERPGAIAFLEWALHPDEYARGMAYPLKDQDVLSGFLADNPDFAEIIPQRQMNSYLRHEYPVLLYPETNYQDGDFILHLAGFPLAQRIELARKWCP